MLSETMPGALTSPSNSSTIPGENRDGIANQANGSAVRVRQALAACGKPAATLADWADLKSALRAMSESLVQLSRRQVEAPLVAEARSLLGVVTEAGGHDMEVNEKDLCALRAGLEKGWPGLLAAMLLVPAWQLPEAPLLSQVPDWLWGDYSTWLFTPPRNSVAPGIAGRFAKHVLPHLEELNHWVGRNAGSTAVRAAAEGYVSAIGGYAWHGVSAGERRHAEVRGQILTRFLTRGSAPFESMIYSRDGRVLRVGFVGRDFGPGSDTYSALSSFEQLDPQGFEVFLFSFQESDTAEARHCYRRARAREVLPAVLDEQLKALREARLDVVFFCGDVGGSFNEVTRLALHRVAHLQVANHRTGLTSGLPEIDLYISGEQPATLEAAAHFTERLGLVRGAGHTYAFPCNATADTGVLDRASLGLPAYATLLATVVTSAGVSVETMENWATVLQQIPGMRLLVIVPARSGESAPNLVRFCGGLEAVFARRGVSSDAVAIFPVPAEAAQAARALLQVADLYLDSLSGHEPGWVAEAMALGLPPLVVSQPAGADRDAAAQMLSAIALPELVAADAMAYVRQAVALAGDTASRDGLRARLKNALECAPVFLDSLAAGDALGALLETAFDELIAIGHPAFRAEHEPLRCFSNDNLAAGLEAGFAAYAAGDISTASFEANLAHRSDPGNPQVRHLRGLVLLAEGNAVRAVEYLMAALPQLSGDAAYWFTLAGALRQNQQLPQAIEALETCLRLDGRHVEALLMLIDLAEGLGATDIAREALECLQKIAPEDPRVLAMS